MTRTWNPSELDAIGAAPELAVAPRGRDGAWRLDTTIWVVRIGDELYVRSYRGPAGSWYRAALDVGSGRIKAGGVESHVSFEQADGVVPSLVDDTYRAKYGRSPYVDAMATPDAVATTLRLVPLKPSPTNRNEKGINWCEESSFMVPATYASKSATSRGSKRRPTP
jgi:hypothetical protein